MMTTKTRTPIDPDVLAECGYHGPRTRDRFTPKERFMRFVEADPNSGCWLWTGGLQRKGYGAFGLGDKVLPAHRAAWILFRGPIPPGEGHHGTCVCHRCDTPSCVNPDHLFLATNRENTLDKKAKGREPLGEDRANAKLTWELVPQIRGWLASGWSQQSIANKLGVGRSCIRALAEGRTWRSA